jgi:hypothetical protein
MESNKNIVNGDRRMRLRNCDRNVKWQLEALQRIAADRDPSAQGDSRSVWDLWGQRLASGLRWTVLLVHRRFGYNNISRSKGYRFQSHQKERISNRHVISSCDLRPYLVLFPFTQLSAAKA